MFFNVKTLPVQDGFLQPDLYFYRNEKVLASVISTDCQNEKLEVYADDLNTAAFKMQ